MFRKLEKNVINQIPKIIHYCWFGKSKMPKSNQICLKSWKTFLPDYTIKEWNEDNFDINANRYTKEAYEAKKFAFVSDYARFYILYKYGGIYMDTDVEVIMPLDDLLNNKMFAGFEGNEGVNPGLIFASIKGSELVREILESYGNRQFKKEDGSIDTTTVVEYTTGILKKHGMIINGECQKVGEITIYSSEYFCPLDHKTRKMQMTKNTYTIHHYSASWNSRSQKIKSKIVELFGEKTLIRLSEIKKMLKGGNHV